MEPNSFDIHMGRLLVQCDSGHISTLNNVGAGDAVREPLGMITHGWDRTADNGEVVSGEFITDTGILVRDDRIVREDGISTVVNLPREFTDADAIISATEGAGGDGLLHRGGLSNRRRQYLVDNATTVADELNRIFRQVVTEFWIGWYSAEGIAYGIDGVYDLDFANESNPELREATRHDHKRRLINETRLAADQAEVVLELLPSTIEVKVDVYADGDQIL